mmetsp:Transcript_55698/g.166889  ORF Transcript_55698/g.166889 Transcript_55698/m.166889 type:complete len:341 (-) Transcript_55698:859-1881(-)
MNLSALISGPAVDMLTIWYRGSDALREAGGEGHDSGREGSWSLTSYRAIILTGIIANFIACMVTFTMREIKVNTAAANSDDERDGHEYSNGSPSVRVSTFVPAKASLWKILRETASTKSFWRFLVVCLITLNVRMIFRHLDATLPKYLVREFGDDIPKGTIYAINPALIIILVPLVAAATTGVDPLLMIHHGSYISAASVFFLVFSTSIWSCILFVTVLSIGEAVWSPRLYEYTMKISKEGREGTYMALSSAPLFLAKLPVGFLSGLLLEKYCPEEGPRESKTMWLIIGSLTASSPVIMTILWPYLSKDDSDTAKYVELTTHETCSIETPYEDQSSNRKK